MIHGEPCTGTNYSKVITTNTLDIELWLTTVKKLTKSKLKIVRDLVNYDWLVKSSFSYSIFLEKVIYYQIVPQGKQF